MFNNTIISLDNDYWFMGWIEKKIVWFYAEYSDFL